MDINTRFKRRIGPDPHLGGRMTAATPGCPDVWEMEDGSFAIVGYDATLQLRDRLPQGASCGPEESVVIVPRTALTRAKKDIPDV